MKTPLLDYTLFRDYWYSFDCTPFQQPTITITYVPIPRRRLVDIVEKGLLIDYYA